MAITDNEIGLTCAMLRTGTALPKVQRVMNEGADLIERMYKDFKDCRNQLCLYCGSYKEAHLGSCDGCRWKH